MNKINLITSALLMSVSVTANAGIITEIGSGWEVLASEDQSTYKLTPGFGGQYFDAEYLLYKYNETSKELTVALQTGFDVTNDNHIIYNKESYWGGDIFLSFDGDDTKFEYALDFGFATGTWSERNKSLATSGSISAVDSGLYDVTSYNNDTYYNSDPFAMQSGTLIGDSSSVDFNEYQGFNADGYDGNNISYVKTATFNLGLLATLDISKLDAHWTMSCGNDGITGHGEIPPTSVPEPSSIALLSTGLIGLLGGLFVRRKRNQQL